MLVYTPPRIYPTSNPTTPTFYGRPISPFFHYAPPYSPQQRPTAPPSGSGSAYGARQRRFSQPQATIPILAAIERLKNENAALVANIQHQIVLQGSKTLLANYQKKQEEENVQRLQAMHADIHNWQAELQKQHRDLITQKHQKMAEDELALRAKCIDAEKSEWDELRAQHLQDVKEIETAKAHPLPSTFASSNIEATGPAIRAQETPFCLESRLSAHCLPTDDILQHPILFKNFIEPNEIEPQGIAPTLEKITTPGVIVSVGTHRSLFDLILCPSEKCTGVVIVDIHPHVKAFMDFLILLLKISDDIQEFQELSSRQIDPKKMEKIREKIASSPFITEAFRSYYLQHLERYSTCYFSEAQAWRNNRNHAPSFAQVQYHKDPAQFTLLQRKAREGNIVACEGNINELTFLGDIPIAAIDTSNVSSYTPLDIKTTTRSNPIVIETTGTGRFPTQYISHPLPTPMSDEDRQELKTLLRRLSPFSNLDAQGNYTGDNINHLLKNYAGIKDRYPGFKIEYLQALREMLKRPEWVVTSQGLLLLGQPLWNRQGVQLDTLPQEEIERLREQLKQKGMEDLFLREARRYHPLRLMV